MKPSFNQASETYNQYAKIQGFIRKLLLEKANFLKLPNNLQNLVIVDAGCGTGLGFKSLIDAFKLKYQTAQIHIIGLDASKAMLEQAELAANQFSKSKVKVVFFKFLEKLHIISSTHIQIQITLQNQDLQTKYENIANNSVDVIFSNLAIQWCDDLSAVFTQWQRILKPDGVILCSTLGVDTFKELRFCGLPTRDFIDLHDVGDLLIANGFVNPVLEAENIIVQYDKLSDFLKSLRKVGANLKNAGDNNFYLGKKTHQKITATYETLRLENQKLPVTYEAIFIHAWKKSTIQFSSDFTNSDGVIVKTFPLNLEI